MAASERKKWLFALFTTLLISLLLVFSIISGLSSRPYSSAYAYSAATSLNRGPRAVASFAYYIYGGEGDKEQILRLLLAVYHPRNRYLLHLNSDASGEEREWLAAAVLLVPAVRTFGNVDVVGKPIWLTEMGATNIASSLRAAAILMKLGGEWDWFVTLSAQDYPLLTQDDLAFAFSSIKRDLNFLDHTSDLGWKEEARVRPIVVDPSIYLARSSQLFTATEKRPTPASFKVFTGSPWVILSRHFLEYSIFGWDNLPRTILMYFNNVLLPQEGYFHSVICNSPEFSNTTVNSDLRFMIWDNPPKMDPHFLGVSYFDQMIQSGAAFARRFKKDDPVLTMIDWKILQRRHNRVAPGAWCTGSDSWFTDACAQLGDINSLKPGHQAKRFSESMTNHLDDLNSQSTQCK